MTDPRLIQSIRELASQLVNTAMELKIISDSIEQPPPEESMAEPEPANMSFSDAYAKEAMIPTPPTVTREIDQWKIDQLTHMRRDYMHALQMVAEPD